MLKTIQTQTKNIMTSLLAEANPRRGEILVVGCSTSEIVGGRIGKNSTPEIASAILDVMIPIAEESGIYIAAQCCEHLNRALVVERECAEKYDLDEVCVVPVPKAGGSLAAAAYQKFKDPVVVEKISAHLGIDIGDTLIGMHLKSVAVPVRTEENMIGNAGVVCARTRPKYIGGERACYDKNAKNR